MKSNEHINSCYEFEVLPLIHEIAEEDEDNYKFLVENSDVIITQPISDGFKGFNWLGMKYLLENVKPNCQVITFPVLYFQGYNPELCYLKDHNGMTFHGSVSDYHDITFLAEFFSIPSPTINAEKTALDSIQELRVREKNLTIKVSSFIQENYKKERLFHTLNHPSKPMLIHLVSCILDTLGDNKTKNNTYSELPDLLSRNIFPISNSVYENLGLLFDNRDEYIIKGNVLSRGQIKELYFNEYKKYPFLKFNLK